MDADGHGLSEEPLGAGQGWDRRQGRREKGYAPRRESGTKSQAKALVL